VPWPDAATLQRRLKADLGAARREGDAELVSVLRVLMGAVANAEAVDLAASQPRDVDGWAEVPRRRLGAEDLAAILQREADDFRAAAREYDERGVPQEAERLRRCAGLVDRYRAGPV
jgi:uncharacterized protein YqeY